MMFPRANIPRLSELVWIRPASDPSQVHPLTKTSLQKHSKWFRDQISAVHPPNPIDIRLDISPHATKLYARFLQDYRQPPSGALGENSPTYFGHLLELYVFGGETKDAKIQIVTMDAIERWARCGGGVRYEALPFLDCFCATYCETDGGDLVRRLLGEIGIEGLGVVWYWKNRDFFPSEYFLVGC